MAAEIRNIPKGDVGPLPPAITPDDAEDILYQRAGREKPAPRPQTAAEHAVETATFDNLTPEALALKTGRMAQAAASGALQAQRVMKDLKDTVGIQSVNLVGIQDSLTNLRRALRIHDQSVKATESAANPQLNPLLSQYLPFDSQAVVEEFFEVDDRTVALQRYISKQLTWDPATFCHDMVALLCTFQYRIGKLKHALDTAKSNYLPISRISDYSFPGERQTYSELTYIPARLEQFLKSAAEFVARESGKVADMKQVRKQLRRAFQASKVRHEREVIGERTKHPDDRPKKKQPGRKKRMPTKRRRHDDSDSEQEAGPSGQQKPPAEDIVNIDSDSD